MIYLAALISGFFTGQLLGYIAHKYTKWVDGKQQINDYMAEKYGEQWSKLGK
jgi:hypothetical protein